MKLIVGLGNPGQEYELSRHNTGFLVLDRLAEKLNVRVNRRSFQALTAKVRIGDEIVILMKPQTYMNNSGMALQKAVRYYRLDPTRDVLVIYDDMDLPAGKIRLREKGSSGGHNGIKSIIANLSTESFYRIRVGIGSHQQRNVIDYVLGKASGEGKDLWLEGIEKAALAANEFIYHTTRKRMNDLWQLLGQDKAVRALTNREKGLSQVPVNAESLIIAASFKQQKRLMVVVKNNLYTAQQLFRKLTPLLQEDVLLFSVEESLRVEAVASTPTMYADQMETLTDICLNDKPRVIITHPTALVRYLPSPETFRNHILHLETGMTIRMKDLKEKLVECGYRYTNRVDQPLTFSMRGDVVDVFSIQENHPVRIEFFDDEIDSIRFFDMASQTTVQRTDKITIVPASALIYDEDFEPVERRIREQLRRDVTRCDFPDELTGAVERDIEYLKKHIFEHYLYK